MSEQEDLEIARLAEAIRAALDDGKAVDIKVLDVRKLTVITDYMIIASGRSTRQVKALADRAMEAGRLAGFRTIGIEGEQQSEWILIDLGGVIVHVMTPATRDFYQLEKHWAEAKTILRVQ